jgi:hypothetical protein
VAGIEGLEGKATRSSEGVVNLKALDAYVTERVGLTSPTVLADLIRQQENLR